MAKDDAETSPSRPRHFAPLVAVLVIAYAACGATMTMWQPRTTARTLLPTVTVPPGVPSGPRTLVYAAPQEIDRIALDDVRLGYKDLGTAPQVVLSRAVTNDNLTNLGLGSIPQGTIETPPLWLVIFKGEFGTPNAPGFFSGNERYRYVAYVYDLWAGVPTPGMASPDGGVFRIALNDPSLPVVPTLIPVPPSVGTPTLHYGETAPPIATATAAPPHP